MSLDWLDEELRKIEEQGLLRKLREMETPQGAVIELDGQKVVNFCSNDYLGLASDPRLANAARAAALRWGTGSGSSRLIAGNLRVLCDLERELARFKGTEAALVYTSGYHANLGIIPTLAGKGDVVFSDALNHASVIDGCRLAGARTEIYNHCDPEHLDKRLAKVGKDARKIVVTESLFSMEGDLAPLPEILEVSRKHGAALVVDDAHATGVLGAEGKGGLEYFGVGGGEVDVLMGTLGKALGGSGAFLCGSARLTDYLVNRSRTFIFTTGPSPLMAATALEALRLVREEPWRREKALAGAERVRSAMDVMGIPTGGSRAAIVPAIIGDPVLTMRACESLLEKGIYVQGIRPPTVPAGSSRLRMTFSALHTEKQVNELIEALSEVLNGRE